MPHGEPIISWQAPEYKHYPKNIWWYMGLLVVAAGLSLYQISRGDYFGAAMLAFVLVLAAIITSRKPETVDVHLTNTGLTIHETHLPYRHIKHFWIVNDGVHKSLNFETTAYVQKWIVVELHEQDPQPVRSLLLQILPEYESEAPTFAQWFAHKLKL